MKLQLIDDARDWWRFWSMRVLTFWAAAIGAWPQLSDEQRAAILGLIGVTPDQMAGIAALAMLVSVASVRVVKQP